MPCTDFGRYATRAELSGADTIPDEGRPVDSLSRVDRLPELMLELTDTLGADFDIAGLLYGLARASIQLLDIDSAGVLLLDEQGRLIPVAATHNRTDHLEQLQADTDRGPCLESIRGDRDVSCPDIDHEPERWPDFARQARDDGFRSVYAVPMSLHHQVVGGLNLFSRATGALSDADRRVAVLLATAAATGLVHWRTVNHIQTVNGQLQNALSSRIAIEQAKGFIAARLRMSPELAFDLLRARARSRREPLTQVARAVVASQIDIV